MSNASGQFEMTLLELRMLLSTTAVPRPDHVVVVMEENHSFRSIFTPSGTSPLPYLNALAAQGALLTNVHATTHPSQPNYLALFSGSTQGVSDNSYVQPGLRAANLGGELIAAGDSFAGYSEDQPTVGYTGEEAGDYAKKHNPWVDFADVPPADNLPLTRFPRHLNRLPTVSFIVPNQQHDMHDGTPRQADDWLQAHLGRYFRWARSHNSLLIVTWDEGDPDNHIATLMVGPMVRHGTYAENVNHYSLLRTLEDMYGLSHAGASRSTAPIIDVWAPPRALAVAPAAIFSGTLINTHSSNLMGDVWMDVVERRSLDFT